MPSYEKINYLLRPNKSVERKMVCEMLSGLSLIKDLSVYQYIGFGSTYFADFSLFHRNLGISKMISMEKDDSARERCEFNKPYGCIELKMGESSTILPNLEIDKKSSIIWLDYDESISDTVFSDINTVVNMITPDSFFMLTINADIASIKFKSNEENIDLTQAAVNLIGEERFPTHFLDLKMNQKNYQDLLYQCIVQEISSAVYHRNGMEDNKVVFHQTVYFDYRDNSKMLTVGGFLFLEKEVETHLERMGIQNLSYYNNDKNPYSIECPILSLKEIQALNCHLPCKEMGEKGNFEDIELNRFPVDNSDINRYASLYRYFPLYAEALL